MYMLVVVSREASAAEPFSLASEHSQPRRTSDGGRPRHQLRLWDGYYACFASSWWQTQESHAEDQWSEWCS